MNRKLQIKPSVMSQNQNLERHLNKELMTIGEAMKYCCNQLDISPSTFYRHVRPKLREKPLFRTGIIRVNKKQVDRVIAKVKQKFN